MIFTPALAPMRVAPALIMLAASSYVDRKSTRLNSSHGYISYAVFCLKKKKKNTRTRQVTTKLTKNMPLLLQPLAPAVLYLPSQPHNGSRPLRTPKHTSDY